MKKIFRILTIAALALGAVACDNTIDDNISPEQNGESVSITVSIAEPTKVALGEAVDGKLPLVFELNDQLCVSDHWGGYGDDRDFWFTCTAADVENNTYTFTCEKEGVGAIVGTERNVFYFGGAPAGNGAVCNTELESIKGVGMSGGTSALGTDPISLDVNPVLKLTADFPVTLEASEGTFSSSKGRWATSYTTTTTGTIYVPMYNADTYDLSVVVKGQTVKKATGFKFEKNKIYNLGTIEAPEEEVADGDPAGIEITIDGVFTDWNNITKNVATVADGADYTIMKTMKAYADANNIYVYAEMVPNTATVHWGLCLDLDADPATGYTKAIWDDALQKNWKAYGCEVVINDQCIYNSEIIEYAWGSNNTYNSDGSSKGSFTFNGARPVFENGVLYVEVAIPYSEIPEVTTKNISVVSYVKDNWALAGALPGSDTLVIPVRN